MSNWWITFADNEPACAGMSTFKEAYELGDAVGEVVNIERLPYAASPRLDDKVGWGEGQMPSFCYTPQKCRGRGSCPNCPSCVD